MMSHQLFCPLGTALHRKEFEPAELDKILDINVMKFVQKEWAATNVSR